MPLILDCVHQGDGTADPPKASFHLFASLPRQLPGAQGDKRSRYRDREGADDVAYLSILDDTLHRLRLVTPIW